MLIKIYSKVCDKTALTLLPIIPFSISYCPLICYEALRSSTGSLNQICRHGRYSKIEHPNLNQEHFLMALLYIGLSSCQVMWTLSLS
jgi:hypothetical protein